MNLLLYPTAHRCSSQLPLFPGGTHYMPPLLAVFSVCCARKPQIEGPQHSSTIPRVRYDTTPWPRLQHTTNLHLLPTLNTMRHGGHIFLCCRRPIWPLQQTPIQPTITKREPVSSRRYPFCSDVVATPFLFVRSAAPDTMRPLTTTCYDWYRPTDTRTTRLPTTYLRPTLPKAPEEVATTTRDSTTLFTNTRCDVVAHTGAHVRSQWKVALDLKSWCMGFTEFLGFCLFLGS
jgi:hypothetical protein